MFEQVLAGLAVVMRYPPEIQFAGLRLAELRLCGSVSGKVLDQVHRLEGMCYAAGFDARQVHNEWHKLLCAVRYGDR